MRRRKLEKIPGVRRVFGGPYFNEFVVEFPRSVKMINAALLREKIIGPFPLGTHYPELTKRGLVLRDGDHAARGNRTDGWRDSENSREPDLRSWLP